MKITVLLLIAFALVSGHVLAQNNTMWLTNGKKLTIGDFKIEDDHNGDSVLIFTNHKGKEKHKYIDEVFSVVDVAGNEQVVYHKNDSIGEILNVKQMRSYVEGRYDGKNTKISPLVGITAASVGVLGAVIPNPVLTSGSTKIEMPIGLLVPASHAVIVGGMGTPDKVLKKNFPDRLNDEYYIIGVDQSLRRKRVKQSLLYGLAGFLAGTIVIYSVN